MKKKKKFSLLLLLAMVIAVTAFPAAAQAASKKPAKPVISAVRSTGSYGYITVSAKISNGVTGYQFKYAANSKFENARIKTTNVPSFQFEAKPTKTYYIRARAIAKIGNKRYYSPWSKVVKMTQPIPPGICKLYDPDLKIPGGDETNIFIYYHNKKDKITYKSSNDCVSVASCGYGEDYLVHPNKTVYWEGISCIGQKKGSSVISIYRNNKLIKKYTLKVTSDSKVYLRHLKWKETVKKTWTPGMTSLEKLVAVGDYLMENYSYNYFYSTSYGFSEGYGGDCWASADAIIEFAKDLGVPARAYAPNGASLITGGHIMPVVTIDGVEYYIEAGFDGTAPRGKCIWGVFQPDKF